MRQIRYVVRFGRLLREPAQVSYAVRFGRLLREPAQVSYAVLPATEDKQERKAIEAALIAIAHRVAVVAARRFALLE